MHAARLSVRAKRRSQVHERSVRASQAKRACGSDCIVSSCALAAHAIESSVQMSHSCMPVRQQCPTAGHVGA
eukprot:364709-Chlamydomonas_euryale.AAC.15